MNKFLSRVSLLTLLVSSIASVSPVNAAGVVVTPSTTTVTGSQAVSLSWTPNGSYSAGSNVTIYFSPVLGAAPTAASMAGATVVSSSTSEVVFALTSATSTIQAASVTLDYGSTAQNYSLSIFTVSSTDLTSTVDFGAALVYANGGNLVNVSAAVPATLSFSIRDENDSAPKNTCALGTLSTLTTSTCRYRLRIATNAAGGFLTQFSANHDFATGYATMTKVGDVSGVLGAGYEKYGLSQVVGATGGGRTDVLPASYGLPVIEASPFNSNFDDVPLAATDLISFGNPFNPGPTATTTATTLIEHFATIDAGTPAGNYTQTITYLVTATF